MEQADTDEVVSIGQGEAALRINESVIHVHPTYWYRMEHDTGRSLKLMLFNNASELAKSIPAFKLKASLKGRFWKEMEKVLEKTSG